MRRIVSSNHGITCKVTPQFGERYFFLSIVFGSNNPVERKILWQSLVSFLTTDSNDLLLILVNFNAIRSLNEKSAGSKRRDSYNEDLEECYQMTELKNLRYIGNLYTWNNENKKLNRICCKLDKALINDKWSITFLRVMTTFLNQSISNHSSCIVNYERKKRREKTHLSFSIYGLTMKTFYMLLEVFRR